MPPRNNYHAATAPQQNNTHTHIHTHIYIYIVFVFFVFAFIHVYPVRVCVCVCVCVRACVPACMRVCTHARACMHACMHARMHLCMYVCMYTNDAKGVTTLQRSCTYTGTMVQFMTERYRTYNARTMQAYGHTLQLGRTPGAIVHNEVATTIQAQRKFEATILQRQLQPCNDCMSCTDVATKLTP